MSHQQLPHTDSIQELATFWDARDLTAFEDQLEEVTESVFERETVVQIRLQPHAIDAVRAYPENAKSFRPTIKQAAIWTKPK